MSKVLLHLLVLTNAVLLAFPPSWCCMVRFSSKSAAAKPSCCCQKEPLSPCDDQEQPESPPTNNDCYCHVDSTLPPHPHMLVKDLMVSGLVMTVVDLCPGSIG